MDYKIIFATILASLFLIGCGGTKVWEEEKTYGNLHGGVVNFEFELDESSNLHKIKLYTLFERLDINTEGNYEAELKYPSGETKKTSFTIKDFGKEESTGLKTDMRTLFEITPESGKYALKIIKDPSNSLHGRNMKVKIYEYESEE